ncbi:MAG: hydroxypyruvate isomerase, partial [Planctomycetaceae bacterium]|nr:hydroxypyruvate isomerase [Planctomycetaceae bacterium]
MESKLSRRRLLQSSSILAASAFGLDLQQGAAGEKQQTTPQPLKGNINQSVVHWCFKKYWDIEKTAQVA